VKQRFVEIVAYFYDFFGRKIFLKKYQKKWNFPKGWD